MRTVDASVSDRRTRMRRAAAREVERRDTTMSHTPGSRRASSMRADARRKNRIVASCARAPWPTHGARTRRLDGDSRKASGVPHVSLSESGAALRARRERRKAGEKGPTAETHLPVDVYAGNRSDEHPSSATRVALCRRVRRRRRFPIKSESGSRKVLASCVANRQSSHEPECELLVADASRCRTFRA